MITKADAIKIIEELPDSASLEDIFDQLYLMEKIEKGLRSLEAGEVYTSDEVRAKVKEWSKSSGPAPR
jgi:predicted transcriptional regulator